MFVFTTCEEKGGEFEGLWYNRGTCYLMSGDWAKSIEDYTRSIEKNQFTDDARYNLGICHMQLGEYEAAVAALDEVVSSMENRTGVMLNDAVYYFRGVCNEALGKYEEAIKDLTTCIDHGYEPAQCYYERAQVYAAMGDTENQTKDLENSMTNIK